MGNIRSKEAVLRGLWDWVFLNGCFGPVIRPMDIDGCIERRGQFLILEGKPTGGGLSKGQQITLERLASTPGFNVLVFWGDPVTQTITHMWHVGVSEKKPADREGMKRFCERWYDHANKAQAA